MAFVNAFRITDLCEGYPPLTSMTLMERDYHAPGVAVINSTMRRYDTDALVHSTHVPSWFSQLNVV